MSAHNDHALRFEWDATELAIGDVPVDTRFAAILLSAPQVVLLGCACNWVADLLSLPNGQQTSFGLGWGTSLRCGWGSEPLLCKDA